LSKKHVLILGGTNGLGRELSVEALKRGYTPIVTGRTLTDAKNDPRLYGAKFGQLDLTKPTDEIRRWLHFDISHIFWVAGILIRKPLVECSQADLERMNATHFLGPVNLLTNLHRDFMDLQRIGFDSAYHLVTIASTSSWKTRDNETLYCALKAAKAHFTRNFARELARDLPGSKTTLINPGGIATKLFADTNQDTSAYMTAEDLAQTIWNQGSPFEEYQIPRDDQGQPDVQPGQATPQKPF